MPGWGGKLGLAEDTLKDSGNKSIQNASKFLKDTMRSFGFKPVCNTSKSVELALWAGKAHGHEYKIVHHVSLKGKQKPVFRQYSHPDLKVWAWDTV